MVTTIEHRHPVTGLPYAGNGETCLECGHRVIIADGDTRRSRCDLAPSTAPDIQTRWPVIQPACTRWDDTALWAETTE